MDETCWKDDYYMSIKLTKQKKIPVNREKLMTEDKETFYNYMKNVFNRINDMFGGLVDDAQFNPPVFKQDSMPTPDKRELVVWKDTDATSGDATYYLVFKTPDGTVISFASEETVP